MSLCAFAVIFSATSLSTAAQKKSSASAAHAAQPVELSIAPGLEVKYPLTGRVLVCISKEAEGDPCKQIGYDYTSQQIYGQDVTNLAQGQSIQLNDTVFGYPIARLADLPAGDYRVEATFNVYEDFHLVNGHTVSLPPDRGEGQQWGSKPGNPVSAVAKIHLDPADATPIKIVMDHVNPPAAPPDADTKYMKHVSMRSEMLSRFWGRDTYLSAWVLLPPGFDEHPDAHYPELIWQDHFAAHFRAGAGWRDTPPDPKAKLRTISTSTGRAAACRKC